MCLFCCMATLSNSAYHVSLCACVKQSLLPILEAVCSSQDPAGVDEDSSAPVKIFLVTGLVNVDERLPRLLHDVALLAPKQAERRSFQGVV